MTTLPQHDGFAFRHFAGESDHPHFAHLITACSRVEGNDRVETAEGIASGYAHLERCDPERDLAVRGMTEVALGVHTENPNGAFDLSTGLGYEVVTTSTTYRKPLASTS